MLEGISSSHTKFCAFLAARHNRKNSERKPLNDDLELELVL